MEIKIIEDSKNKLVFDIKGESHGFCNMLKDELWNNKAVKVAAYKIEHPLIGIPRFVLETSGEEPKKVLDSSVKKLKSQAEKAGKELKGI